LTDFFLYVIVFFFLFPNRKFYSQKLKVAMQHPEITDWELLIWKIQSVISAG